MANWFCSSAQYSAVTAWQASHAYSVGDIRRPTAASQGNERVFRCTTAGTSGSSEPTWINTKGGTTSDNGVVWTEITGNSTYAWAAAHARIANACAWGAGGDNVFVGDDHAETVTGSSYQLTYAGSMAGSGGPINVLCVDHTKSSPGTGDLKTGASFTASAGCQAFIGGLNPYYLVYVYGITFNLGSGASGSESSVGYQDQYHRYERCTFALGGSNNYDVQLGGSSSGCFIDLVNCAFSFAAAGQSIKTANGNKVHWRNQNGVAALAGTTPTKLFTSAGYSMANLLLEGLDLSAITNTLFDEMYYGGGIAVLKDCKLSASLATLAVSLHGAAVEIHVIRSDSGVDSGDSVRIEKRTFGGVISTDKSITRVGGANDGTGPSYSRKAVTTGNAAFGSPFKSQPMMIWNTVVGSPVTVTVHGAAAALPKNDEIWIEVEFLSDTASPLGSFSNNTKSNVLASGTAYTEDGETWNNSPGHHFAMSASITPELAGPIQVTVCFGKPSSTFNYDPTPVLS